MKAYRLPLQKTAVLGPVPGPAPAVRVLQTPYARWEAAAEGTARRANTTARSRTTQSKRANTEKRQIGVSSAGLLEEQKKESVGRVVEGSSGNGVLKESRG